MPAEPIVDPSSRDRSERADGCPAAPAARVLALCFPDLPLQRVWRAREAEGIRAPRAPLATEREGHVAACDAEARARGVRPGDALVQACAVCADLEVLPVDAAADRAVLEGAAEALLSLAPRVEVAPPDTLFLDASGAHLLGRGAEGEAVLAARAVALAADLGLRCRSAFASGRRPARALARHAQTHGADPDATAALARLPLADLDLDGDLEARLTVLGLRRAGDLTALPPESLAHRFGAAGLEAWRLARGEDPSPLVPHLPRGLPRERLDLESPVESAEPLLFGLRRLCERVAARLAGRGLGATRLALALQLDPRGEERLEIALARPTCASARWLLVWRERLASLRLPAPVAAAVLEVAEAAPAPPEQLALGDRPEELAALEAVLGRIAARLGDGAVFAAETVDRYRPEAAYRAASFGAPPSSEGRAGKGKARAKAQSRKAPLRPGVFARDASVPARRRVESTSPAIGTSGGASNDASPSCTVARPTRLLPSPQPLVALGEGGRVTAVRAGGRMLRVLEISPAERLAGEWWSEPFERDYHRARLEELGECWIFRDAADGRLWLHGFFD